MCLAFEVCVKCCDPFPEPEDREKAQAAPWALGGPARALPLALREGRGVPESPPPPPPRRRAEPRAPRPAVPPSATPRGQDQQFVELISDTLNFS